MGLKNHLTKEVREGYDADLASTRDNPGGRANPYEVYSDKWLAFDCGVHLFQHGATKPLEAWKSRGRSIKVRTSGQTDFIYKCKGDPIHLDDRTLTRV